MNISYMENYLTFKFKRKNSAFLEKEITRVSNQPEGKITKEKNCIIMKIEKHITKGHEYYELSLFKEAIDEYRQAQTLIYSLLNPSISDSSSKDIDFVSIIDKINIEQQSFIPVLEKAIEIIPELDPTIPLLINDIIDPEKPWLISDIIDSSIPNSFINPNIRTVQNTTDKTNNAMLKNTSSKKSMPDLNKTKSFSENSKDTNNESGVSDNSFRMLNIKRGDDFFTLKWGADKIPSSKDIIKEFYSLRADFKKLSDVNFNYFSLEQFTFYLPHLSSYLIPIYLGDCYNQLGDYEKAENQYLSAANYEYINKNIEAPYIWKKLANNLLLWGDSFYKVNKFEDALTTYGKVVEPLGSSSIVNADSYLYKHKNLKEVGGKVKQMLAEHMRTSSIVEINPQIAIIVLLIRERMIKLDGGLDFLGIPINVVPIWTFEYLQNVSRYFAQQAIQAEREYMNFIETSENKKLTRLQLKQTLDLASAEVTLAKKQTEASEKEKEVYREGVETARVRIQNAIQNKNAYSNMSSEKIHLDAYNTYFGGPEYKIAGTGKKAYEIMYDNSLRAGQISRDFELGAMDRQIRELEQSEKMALSQLNAATSRVEASKQLEVVAQLRKTAAMQNLNEYDSQTFTADVWSSMGYFMKDISNSYLNMAITTAILMQKAYNFEFDSSQNFIKYDYTSNSLNGMLAANALLLDIDSFTYDMITSVKNKNIPVKQTLSLASKHPYLFETSFKKTGTMEFETRMEDFDMDYPGTYSRRIETIEIIVEGLLPGGGLKGFLTNGGISRFRTSNFDEKKFRIQPKDTMVLSEYKLIGNSHVFKTDLSKLKLFESSGTCSSWKLEIPKSSNDIDFDFITDVKIVFYYNTFYNENLSSKVKANLNNIAAVNKKSKLLPLRYIFPDSFFYFQDSGIFPFKLDKSFFPLNEKNFEIVSLSLLVKNSTKSNITLSMTVPSSNPIEAVTNSNGEILSSANHPWNAFKNNDALGEYSIEIKKEDNPSLIENENLVLDSIDDLIIVMEYNYTPVT